jgi:hypothetical protein
LSQPRRAAIEVVTAIGLILALIGGSFYLVFRAMNYDCSEAVQATVPSPDKRYVAVLFEQNCGATSAFSYHVNLRETTHTFNVGGRAIIQDGMVFDCTHIEDLITMTWKGPKWLLIKYPRGDVFREAKSWRDVTIIYRPYGKKVDPNFSR